MCGTVGVRQDSYTLDPMRHGFVLPRSSRVDRDNGKEGSADDQVSDRASAVRAGLRLRPSREPSNSEVPSEVLVTVRGSVSPNPLLASYAPMRVGAP